MDGEKAVKEEEGERLQKVLAQAGIASRRHAEQMILEGRVTVNGDKVSVLGTKVGKEDQIQVDGKSVKRFQKFQYYLLHKPVHVITSAQDPQGRRTVIDLMKEVPVRIYPVGRLDYDTSGVLLLTNDGRLAHRLMHPSYGVEKTYRVWVQGPVKLKALENLRLGVQLEDGKTAPAKVKCMSGRWVQSNFRPDSKHNHLQVLEVTIHEGRNRQIRRMFAAVGYPVVKLERIRFGGLSLETLSVPGSYRELTRQEIEQLQSKVGL